METINTWVRTSNKICQGHITLSCILEKKIIIFVRLCAWDSIYFAVRCSMHFTYIIVCTGTKFISKLYSQQELWNENIKVYVQTYHLFLPWYSNTCVNFLFVFYSQIQLYVCSFIKTCLQNIFFLLKYYSLWIYDTETTKD